MALVEGILGKLNILAYDNENYSGIPLPYQVMYNPTGFSHSLSVEHTTESPVGRSAETQQFRGNNSDNLNMEFLFDATGASLNSLVGEIASLFEVDKQIEAFLNVAWKINGEQHQPRFLIIVWGSFIFKGKLTKADIRYTLFNNEGKPLRATINATFVKHISREQQARETRLFSPDLTKTRLVEEGEHISLVSQRIYGDPSLYLEIARANNLKNFRKLKTGQKIIFPPIKKQENGSQ